MHFFRGILGRMKFTYNICLLEILNVLLWENIVFFGLAYFSIFSESLDYFRFSGGMMCIFFVEFYTVGNLPTKSAH